MEDRQHVTTRQLPAVVAMLSLLVTPGGAGEHDAGHLWSFDANPPDQPPSGFVFGRTGDGADGRWIVLAQGGAPSPPHVLAQLSSDETSLRFPLAVADGVWLRNLRLSAKCKMVSGRVDQACGLVFRYLDQNNYYVTRANALEDNMRLYFVREGRRQQLASWDGEVAAGRWHELRLEAREDHLQVYWDGKKVLDVRDTTFSGPGRVGVWTKADSVTHFDDLEAVPLVN